MTELQKGAGSSEKSNKINLTLINGTGYVFSVDDYMTLRQEHRILGSLVGTCNSKGCSTNNCTLPAELTPLETRLLVDKEIAQLVSKKQSLLNAPTEIELQQYEMRQEAQFQAQAKQAKDDKLRDTKQNMDKIIKGKREKLLKTNVPVEEIKLKPEQILKEVAENFSFEREQLQTEIVCAHPLPHSFEVVPPPQIDNPLKFRVFSELWSSGSFYVTGGDTFGADFLIYPGDPGRYHASHILILLQKPDIDPLALIAKVRVSVNVNKACVFAFFAEDATATDKAERVVQYQTVEWEGGNKKN